MEAFFVSTGIVALAEIGDKTQLLAFMLAARFERPWPIILGIFLATVLNHGLAGALGAWAAAWIDAEVLRWVLGLSFLAMAVWVLIPDEADDAPPPGTGLGVFGATLMAFFLAEIGDKTQVATVALAAQYPSLVAVVMGTTVGMMCANVPAVLLGGRLSCSVAVARVRMVASAVFAVLGVMSLLGTGG